MWNYQLELENQERRAIELTNELEKINRELAGIRLYKEQIENELMGVMEHKIEGSKTYIVGSRSVTLKTDMIYSLDKKLYEELIIPDGFDPVIKKIKYEIDAKLFCFYEKNAPIEVRKLLSSLIDKKPAKLHVSIKERLK